MKYLFRILALLAALTMLMSAAAAETAQDPLVALVNGEELRTSEYAAIESNYLSVYAASGMDLNDEANVAYVQDIALTAAIEQKLIEQDMTAQGCYEFDEETENWLTEQGNAAYEQALADVGAMLGDSLSLGEEDDLHAYALAYAESLGVTVQDYINVYRNQYAAVNYHDWLIRDNPVTDEDVQTEYEAKVAESQALYGDDAEAFETAMSAGREVWYTPAGYRSVLQILLTAEGGTDEEKLASVQAQVDEINARLEGGETFESLIAEYGEDPSFEDESFYATGYQVHPESVVWEDAFVAAAFSEEMQKPGDWSRPFASTLGVHILYYLGDTPAGPVEMTQSIRDALSYTIYQARVETLLNARIGELSETAEVIMY